MVEPPLGDVIKSERFPLISIAAEIEWHCAYRQAIRMRLSVCCVHTRLRPGPSRPWIRELFVGSLDIEAVNWNSERYCRADARPLAVNHRNLKKAEGNVDNCL